MIEERPTKLKRENPGKSRSRVDAVRRTLLWAFALSAAVHFLTVWRIGVWGGEARRDSAFLKPLTLRIKPLPDREHSRQDHAIVETQQAPTEPPKDEARLGAQDHRAERETRLAHRPASEGDFEKFQQNPVVPGRTHPRKERKKDHNAAEIAMDPHGQVRVVRKGKARNAYEALLQDQLAQRDKAEISARDGRPGKSSRTEYLSDDIAEGDRVDLNTTNYKYLSYFIGLRKSIELTWVYPSSAVRQGLQGEVRLEFKIEKDGRMTRIRILSSSGYEILDRAIVDAIKLAAPFAPLPTSMAKDSLLVTATFRYVLYAYNGP